MPHLERSLERARKLLVALCAWLGRGDVRPTFPSPVFVSRSIVIPELALPQDFPVDEFLTAEFEMRVATGLRTDAGHEFAAAWTAVAYRVRDVTSYESELAASLLAVGGAPPPEPRYEQERLLFGFFVAGLSAIESFAYGLTAIAWAANPAAFSLATTAAKRRVTPKWALQQFEQLYPGESVTRDLRRLLNSPEYANWRDVRNALAHRRSPARHHYVGGTPRPTEWGVLALEPATLTSLRSWLVAELRRLLVSAGSFAGAQL